MTDVIAYAIMLLGVAIFTAPLAALAYIMIPRK